MTPFPFPRRGASAAVLAAFSAGFAAGYGWRARAPAPLPTATTVDVVLESRAGGLYAADPDRLPRAEVLSVVDGDTLEVLWNDRPVKLRYFGVNTTERDHACYEEGRARNRELAGGAVRLAFDQRTEDNYGRVLAYVFTAEGRSIDGDLVAEGLGKAWRRDGRFRDRLVALEDAARSERRGCLWSGAPTSTPRTSRRTAGRRARTPRARF